MRTVLYKAPILQLLACPSHSASSQGRGPAMHIAYKGGTRPVLHTAASRTRHGGRARAGPATRQDPIANALAQYRMSGGREKDTEAKGWQRRGAGRAQVGFVCLGAPGRAGARLRHGRERPRAGCPTKNARRESCARQGTPAHHARIVVVPAKRGPRLPTSRPARNAQAARRPSSSGCRGAQHPGQESIYHVRLSMPGLPFHQQPQCSPEGALLPAAAACCRPRAPAGNQRRCSPLVRSAAQRGSHFRPMRHYPPRAPPESAAPAARWPAHAAAA